MGDGVNWTLVDRPEAGMQRVVFEGEVVLDDIISAVKAMSSTGTFEVTARLWDFRGTSPRVSPSELSQVGSLGRAREKAPARVAVLVDDDLQFGLARVLEAYRRSETTDVAVFRDEAESLAWLTD